VPTIEVNSADWAQALEPKYRYIFVKGGRSGGKSHEVVQHLIERSISEKDLKIVCLREIQQSLEKSSKSLVDDKMKESGLDDYYSSIKNEVRKKAVKDSGHFFFQGMNDLTKDNIKSLNDYKIAWFEEAQNMSRSTLKTLRPTIRAAGSQIIFTWNPKFPDDAVDEFCNQMATEPDCLVIHINYTDNPFLTSEVLREVEIDQKNSPEDFNHIWLGDYDTSFHGHYYAALLEEAKAEGRITSVPRKTGVDIVTAWDLGRADSTAIWVAQIVGRETRIIDHIEDSFKDLDFYADWIKENNYNGFHGLPHDAKHSRLGMKGSIQDQLKTMGLTNSRVMPAMKVDAGRRLAKTLIKEAFIDENKCRDGLRALRHEKSVKDERTGRYKEIHELDSAAAFRYLAQHISMKGAPAKTAAAADDYIPHRTGWMG
tara:strand:+ start:108 stop:1385 length:1278 start_codon:yes stop_codon:yes gene_type:complete